MKRITSLILLFVMMFSLSISVSAEDVVDLYVDRKYVQNANGFIENGRTMVPVRALAEKMQSEVIWVESERKVILNKPCTKMEYNGTNYENVVASCELILGKAEIRIKLLKDGKEIFNVLKGIDCKAYTIDGRTHIPARFVGYALGYSVDYKNLHNRHMVYYEFIGKQTIDFEEPTEQIQNKTSEKYPNTITVDGKNYASRNGYDNIVIVDTSNGKIENDKFINLVPYRFTDNNVTIESNEKEYEISNSNTAEENFNNFSNFYEDKTGEDVEVVEILDDLKIYHLQFLTNNNFLFQHFYGNSSDSTIYLYKYLEEKKYYKMTASSPIYDYSKLYYVNRDKSDYGYGVFYGEKVYGNKDDSFLRKGANKNSLLFLNAFLGETGQKIWKMMSDYYTFSGHFYVPQDTEWKKFEDNEPIVFDSINKENVEKYGLKFISSYDEIGETILVLETINQKIHIEYSRPYIIGDLIGGYTVVFEKIEN